MDDPVGLIGQKVELIYWSIDGENMAIQKNLDVAVVTAWISMT